MIGDWFLLVAMNSLGAWNECSRDTAIKENSIFRYLGEGGHSGTRGTVVFFDLFKKLKTLNFKFLW